MITDRDRHAILAGHRASLTYDATQPCPVSEGMSIDLHPHVRLEVTKVVRRTGAWAVAFLLHDFRPRLLHRDSSHGYTQNPALAVPEEPEAVAGEFLARRRLEEGTDALNALARESGREREAATDIRRRLERGVAPRTARALRRRLAVAERHVAAAA